MKQTMSLTGSATTTGQFIMHAMEKQSGVMCHLARLIHWLIVEARAHDVEWRHAKHHHHAADHAGSEGHQPAVLWKHLGQQADQRDASHLIRPANDTRIKKHKCFPKTQ